VHIEGEGFVEFFAWETSPGYAVHLLNYTNPNAHHGWLESTYAIGPQAVAMTLPAGIKAKSVDLLRAEKAIPFQVESQVLHFSFPNVEDFEVAAITLS
jgi:hypothetical protein